MLPILLIQYTAKKVITLTVCNCLNCKIGGHKVVGFSSKMQGKNIFKDLDGCLKWNVNHQSTAADIHRPFLQIAINTRPTSVFVALHGLKSFAVDGFCTSNCLVCELLQRTHFKLGTYICNSILTYIRDNFFTLILKYLLPAPWINF